MAAVVASDLDIVWPNIRHPVRIVRIGASGESITLPFTRNRP